eukprot:scaffold69892_cov71-Phaeocystis_antarctica.AAC.6
MTTRNLPPESFRCMEPTGAPAVVALRPVMQRSSHPGEALRVRQSLENRGISSQLFATPHASH